MLLLQFIQENNKRKFIMLDLSLIKSVQPTSSVAVVDTIALTEPVKTISNTVQAVVANTIQKQNTPLLSSLPGSIYSTCKKPILTAIRIIDQNRLISAAVLVFFFVIIARCLTRETQSTLLAKICKSPDFIKCPKNADGDLNININEKTIPPVVLENSGFLTFESKPNKLEPLKKPLQNFTTITPSRLLLKLENQGKNIHINLQYQEKSQVETPSNCSLIVTYHNVLLNKEKVVGEILIKKDEPLSFDVSNTSVPTRIKITAQILLHM
jgi:hypothetical protein